MNNEIIARWESVTGKYWVEITTILPKEEFSSLPMFYRSDHGGGFMGVMTEVEAIVIMQRRVDLREFLPDDAKHPMERVV